MGTMSASELIHLWAQENLGPERAIGQILQHLVQLHATAGIQRLALTQLRTEVNRLRTIVESPPSAPVASEPKKPPKRR